MERSELRHTIRSTSQRSQSYPSHDLEPNTQYSCHMTSVARKLESGPSTWVEFTTTPGSKRRRTSIYWSPITIDVVDHFCELAGGRGNQPDKFTLKPFWRCHSTEPSPPPQPRVSVQTKEGKTENKSFTAELYPTDNHFGPIRYVPHQHHCSSSLSKFLHPHNTHTHTHKIHVHLISRNCTNKPLQGVCSASTERGRPAGEYPVHPHGTCRTTPLSCHLLPPRVRGLRSHPIHHWTVRCRLTAREADL